MLYTSIAMKNQVGVVVLSGKLWVSRGCSWIRYVRGGYIDVQAGCVYDCGSIRLDQQPSACQVVEFVGACAATLRMSLE